MAQFARPDSDVSAGSWTATPLWQKIDEETASDADIIRSANDPSADVCELGLSDVSDPLDNVTHVIRYRYQKGQSGGGSPGVIDLTVSLFDGVTQIWTTTHSGIGLTWVDGSATLSAGEADSITDYTDLRIKFSANKSAGDRTSWAEVSWAEFECPFPMTGETVFPSSYKKPGLWSKVNRNHSIGRKIAGAWLFNEGGGRPWDIAGPRFQTAIEGGAPAWVPGGMAFEGTVDRLSVSSDDARNLANTTYNGFFMLLFPTALNRVVARKVTPLNTTGRTLEITSTGEYKYSTIMDNGVGATVTSDEAVVLNEWISVACVSDPDAALNRIYLDGRQDAESALNNPLDSGAGAFYIGGQDNTFKEFSGSIGLVIVFSAPLTAGEVLSLHLAPYCWVAKNPIRRFAEVVITTTRIRDMIGGGLVPFAR
jgi:hypothetical protein